MTMTDHVMTVSSNGQVSIPAQARARWNTHKVLVVDLGDRIVMRPLPGDAVGELKGKYQGAGPDTTTARAQARRDEATRTRR
jgi:AbrB family looped-hinge helix DNA binding protein